MIINKEMYNKISETFFSLFGNQEKTDRKKIKILYDATIEQVSEKLFNINYRNYLTTLAELNQINENLIDSSVQENSLKIDILKKLRNMLEENCPLDDRSYTDKSQDILAFIKNKFLPFIMAILDYDILEAPSPELKKLKQYLESLQNERK